MIYECMSITSYYCSYGGTEHPAGANCANTYPKLLQLVILMTTELQPQEAEAELEQVVVQEVVQAHQLYTKTQILQN